MEGVAGIRFTEAGPLSYCSPGDLLLGIGDYVVVRTQRGERLGWVVVTPDQVIAAELEGPLRVIDRLASAEDVSAWRQQRTRAEEDTGRAQAVAARSDPRVRVASVSYDLAGRLCDVTVTAPDRADTGSLSRHLSDALRAETRVEQVGDRDRAKAVGGQGLCGRGLCCSTWMTEFPAISMKMAKEQDLPPNPTKISGVCGRLLCCLAFEVDAYRELRGDLPKVGKRVTTPAGRAKVLSVNSLKQVVRLRMDDTGEVVEIAADEMRKQYGNAVRPEELEPVVEVPARARDQRQRDSLLMLIEPVSAPSGVRVAGDGETDADGAEVIEIGADGEPIRRRRRRGRRGGRRRRGAEGTTEALGAGGAGEPSAAPDAAIDDTDDQATGDEE